VGLVIERVDRRATYSAQVSKNRGSTSGMGDFLMLVVVRDQEWPLRLWGSGPDGQGA